MHVQRIRVPARRTDSGQPHLTPSEVSTLCEELTNLRDVLTELVARLAPAEVHAGEPAEATVSGLANPSHVPTSVNHARTTAPTTVATTSIVLLKALLRQRHWQTHARFCREYDKAARSVDPGLVGSAPSRAQLHRWLAGDLKRLPHPHHCEVLEAMFPGHSAAELFRAPSARLRVVA